MQFVIILLFNLLLCSSVYAAPSINSASSNSASSSTISGSSFGTKSTVQPTEWDTFERGTISVNADIGTWSNIHSLTITGETRGISTKSATLNFTGVQSAICTSNNSILSAKWFASYWFKLANDWDWGTTGEGAGNSMLANVKCWWRIWNPGDTLENYVTATSLYGGTGFVDLVEGTDTSVGYFGTVQTAFTKGVWHQLKMQYSENSSVGASDGTVTLWIDGQIYHARTNLQTRKNENLLKRPHLGFYNSWKSTDPSHAPNGYYMDDVYCDSTWQRIEVGNASTYAMSTHTEMQIQQTWSDTSITFTSNQGSFANGEQVYLFVVDANGDASNGYAGYFLDGQFYSGEVSSSLSNCSIANGTIN